MKKKQLREENEMLKEKLRTSQKELQQFKRAEEYDKINAILEQLKPFGFGLDLDIKRHLHHCECSTTETYTLQRTIIELTL